MFSLFLAMSLITGLTAYAGDRTLDPDYYYYQSCTSNPQVPGAAVCLDGSLSFEQPDSTGINGYEGKCGQTAWANLIGMYCKGIEALPDDFWVSDWTPGTNVGTFRDALNEAFTVTLACSALKWSAQSRDRGEDFLKGLNAALSGCRHGGFVRRGSGSFQWRCPVPVLMFVGGEVFGAHWATVVDIEGYDPAQPRNCNVIANTWRKQYRIPCGAFAGMARVPALGTYQWIEPRLAR